MFFSLIQGVEHLFLARNSLLKGNVLQLVSVCKIPGVMPAPGICQEACKDLPARSRVMCRQKGAEHGVTLV